MFSKDRETDKWFSSQGTAMVEKLGVQAGWTVLDIGCGIGSYCIPLSRVVGKAGRVIAVDISKDSGKAIEKQLKKMGWEADSLEFRLVAETPRYEWIADSSLDAVWLFDVLQHISRWNPLLAELRRMLREEGLLYVNPSEMMHPDSVDYPEFKEKAVRHGFHEIDRHEMDLMHYKKMGHDRVYTLELSG